MMSKKGVLICLTGIDGSGKTTHAVSIVKYLSQDRVKCRYVWARGAPITLKPIVILARALLFKRNVSHKDYFRYTSAKRKYLRNNLAKIWQNLVLFNFWLEVLVKIRIPLLFGNVIICDRYLYDALVDFAVDSSYSIRRLKNMLKIRIISLFPQPDVVFLLDIPEKVAFRRKSDVPALTYLIDRRKFYLALADECSFMKVLDNSGDLEKTQGEIRNEVYRILGFKHVKQEKR